MLPSLSRRLLSSVRGRLVLLVVALLAPALLIVAALMRRAYENERVVVTERLLANARAVGGIVDREFHEFDAVLRTIAASPELAQDNLPAVSAMARESVNRGGRWFVLADEEYRQQINTLVAPGQPLPAIPDDPAMREAMARGESYVSNLFESPVSQNVVLHVSRPVRRDDRLRYTLHLAVKPQDFATSLGVAQFASSGLVSVVDRNGRIAARSRNPEKYIGGSASPLMISLLRSGPEGVQDTRTLDGIEVITAWHHAPLSGWGIIVATPKSTLTASAERLFWLGLGLSVLLVAVAGAFALWIARGLTGAVDSLVASAAAIQRGEPTSFQPSGLAETDTIGSAMIRTAQHLERSNTELRSAMERLRFSLSSLALGDWSFETAGDEVELSPRAAAIYGLPANAGRVARLDLRAIVHPEDREAVRLAAGTALQGGQDYRVEHRIVRSDGTVRWVAVAGRAVRSGEGQPVSIFGVVQDITELKHAEHVLRTQNEVLEARVRERTQRLSETVGELEAFSYSISHDMRTPLRAMHNYAHLLQTEHAAQLDEMGRHYLGRIEANAARLDLLIRDVLAYSKVAKEQIATKPVDLDRFTRELVAQIPEAAARGAVVEIPRPLPAVLAHEAYLSQIFTNLIGNGVKFVTPGTTPRIEITAEAVNGSVRVTVRDNGIGIAATDCDRIFQIFGRLHPSTAYEGTGIGLAIVKKAVQRMGGEIGVESAPGHGSSFWFTLSRA